MIKIIHGKNILVTKKTLKEIRGSFKDVNFIEIDMEDGGSFVFLSNQLRMSGLFGNADTVVIKNFFSSDESEEISKKDIAKSIEKYSGDIYFFEFYEVKKTDLSLFNKISNVVEVKNDVFDFKKNKPEIISFLKNYAKEKGYVLDARALQSLLNGYKDILSIVNEMDKLGTYSFNITQDSFSKLSVVPFESNLFRLVEAMALKNKETAYLLLEKELKNGVIWDILFGMVLYQFRNLIIVKESLITGKGNPGLNLFVFNNLKQIVQNIPIRDLIKYYFELFQYNKKIKKGEMSHLHALECFVQKMR